jgi:hypothetical protein
MREVLGDLLRRCCSVWIDDILQYAKNSDGLIHNLEMIFEALKEHNVYMNPEKTQLCTKSVTWCGRIIDEYGVKFDDSMIAGLMEIRKPEKIPIFSRKKN